MNSNISGISPPKKKVYFSNFVGYILAVCFLIILITFIILYFKIPPSQSDQGSHCQPGDEFAACDSKGKCFCDCSPTCTKSMNVQYNTSTNVCSVDNEKICPTSINSLKTGLDWNSNNKTCELASDWNGVACPSNCVLGTLCPLGTFATLTDTTTYDPRVSQAKQGRCYGQENLFKNTTNLQTWCDKVGWTQKSYNTHGVDHWYCDYEKK